MELMVYSRLTPSLFSSVAAVHVKKDKHLYSQVKRDMLNDTFPFDYENCFRYLSYQHVLLNHCQN